MIDLWNDDPQPDGEPPHAERERRFNLAGRNCCESAADDLGRIGGARQAERQDACGQWAEFKSELRKAVIDEENLHQLGRAANVTDIALQPDLRGSAAALPQERKTCR